MIIELRLTLKSCITCLCNPRHLVLLAISWNICGRQIRLILNLQISLVSILQTSLSQLFFGGLIILEEFQPRHYQAPYRHLKEQGHHFEFLCSQNIQQSSLFSWVVLPSIRRCSSDTCDCTCCCWVSDIRTCIFFCQSRKRLMTMSHSYFCLWSWMRSDCLTWQNEQQHYLFFLL